MENKTKVIMTNTNTQPKIEIKEDNVWHSDSIILKTAIRVALYDIEVMIDELELKTKNLKKYSIYKRLYDIHWLLKKNNF